MPGRALPAFVHRRISPARAGLGQAQNDRARLEYRLALAKRRALRARRLSRLWPKGSDKDSPARLNGALAQLQHSKGRLRAE